MQIQVRLRDPGGGWEQDVLLDADPDTPLADVTSALATVRPGELWLGAEPLGTQGVLAGCGLRNGVVVTVADESASAAPPGAGPQRQAAVELSTVSGPFAGRRWPILASTIVIGRDPAADIAIDDPAASRHHARLTWHADGVPAPATAGAATAGAGTAGAGTAGASSSADNGGPVTDGPRWVVEDLGSRNGTWVNGQRLSAPCPLDADAAIEVGSSVLELRSPVPADADVITREDGSLAFNRPARLQPGARNVKVQAPSRPSTQEKFPFPWAQAIAPLVMGGVLYAVTRQVATLGFILLSPVLIVSSTLSQRKRQKKQRQTNTKTFSNKTESARKKIEEAAQRELTDERVRWLDPAATAATVLGPGRRLWERREYDLDALVLRVGVVDRPSAVEVTHMGDPDDEREPGDPPPITVPVLPVMPVVVDLRAAGVLGVAGPDDAVAALARWLVTQIAAWHSPKSVMLCLLTSPEDPGSWEWSRWLPHLWREAPGGSPLVVGNDPASREERVKELLKLLDARAQTSRGGDRRDQIWLPAVVVVLDSVRALRSLPGVPRLLREGPRYGIYSIGLDRDAARLAEEGRAEVVFEGDQSITATVQVNGEDPVTDVLVDQVEPAWADELARGLSPLRDAGGQESGAMIPTTVRFIDLVGIDPDASEQVVARWQAAGRTTSAVVGVSVDGPFVLDLRRDGPHALVAGTTGAGKSEFLQTLVASLALANRPDAINFVLVDYKGASAFADCAELPHTVGMVTNLDGQETQRALTSLNAELHRRERRLSELRAADIDAAWDKDPDGAARAGLARLVLVIDEFAELVQELPDFVTGLIRIARVGRSLGVHLILATQRPAGVVTGEMRANTGLRIALRMEDPGDSQEVLEAKDAASISRATPGRAFARMGGGASIVAFQSARVAGRRRGESVGLAPPWVLPLPWARVGYPVPARLRAAEKVGAATDLHALVRGITKAAVSLNFPPAPSPWLPPLPARIGLGALETDPLGEELAVPFGIEDLPGEQRQQTAMFDLVRGGHLAVAGAARSGRSTFLRTLAASLAGSVSPTDVHLYALDFGNGALLPLAALPHCGAVVVRSEGERIQRLVERLSEEIKHRQEVLALEGFGDIAEQRRASPPDDRLPYMVLMLDRWEGFSATYPIESGSELPGLITRLVREGPGVGLHLVLAGDRSLLSDRIASLIEDRLVMRLNDREDYRLVNLNPKHIAETMGPGRALRADSGNEIQLALIGDAVDGLDPAGQVQAEAVRTLGARAAERWPEPRPNQPLRVDTLPSRVTTAEVDALVADGQSLLPDPVPDGGLWTVLGVGGDKLQVYALDLIATNGFIVAGPPQSGRSTALTAMVRRLALGGARVVAVCPRPSPLTGLADLDGVEVLESVPGPDVLEAAVQKARASGRPVAVVVDDADVFARSEADETLRDLLRDQLSPRLVAVVAGPTEELKVELRGTVAEARKATAGMLFSPSSTFDGDLVGVRLPKPFVTRMPPGRACLAWRGDWFLVQVPLVG
ncbi:MAG: FtsK/SpoIIIE domain-containing protein [Actinomycetota bacterium]|nr:FtsK/SpoIIIE domain-containing protein [Actinomycetota bacterium]